MTLHYQPNFGQILICDFPKEFNPPEMVKRRPVICVSPKHRTRHRIATVVPLSTTEPIVKTQFNVEVILDHQISPKYPELHCWAKCDMLYTLSLDRLSAPLISKQNGKREYNFMILPPGTMCEILTGVLAGLGIEGSIKYERDIYKVFDFPSLEPVSPPW